MASSNSSADGTKDLIHPDPDFYVCRCFYTHNIFLQQYNMHVTFYDEDQFIKDWKSVSFVWSVIDCWILFLPKGFCNTYQYLSGLNFKIAILRKKK